MKETAFSAVIPVAALLMAVGRSRRWMEWDSETDERRLLINPKVETMIPADKSHHALNESQQAGEAGLREEKVKIQEQRFS